jgi:cytosine/adenosine deaminase-related metal-dependent hydrolase
MAASGAVAGLCPVTEANLGDGVFPANRFLGAGGRFGVGSDSNVFVSLPEELRQLEYSQRLFHRSRNVIAAPGQSTGERLFREAVAGGAQSLQGGGPIAMGNDADLVSLDLSACDHLPASASLDQWIFARGVSVDCVWVRGVKRVKQGQHTARDAIASRFRAVMRSLAEKM